MAKYIVRIELHSATGVDYDNLHEKMKKAGFSVTIPATDGNNYQLPTATYYADTNQTKDEVYDVANTIANSVKTKNWIVVVKSDGIKIKLDKAK